MPKSYTRAKLITEIASFTRLDKDDIAGVLEFLAYIAYREARNGFIVPGICKLKVVRRKAQRCRNPATKQLMLIGERDALKITPLKKAKDSVCPRPPGLVQIIKEEPKKKTEPPAEAATPRAPQVTSTPPAPSAPSTPSPPPAPTVPQEERGQIVFYCPECGTTLAAPPHNAGAKAECPVCGAQTTVPTREQPAAEPATSPRRPTRESRAATGTPKQSPAQQRRFPSGFVTFLCRACGQEIEAPVDMIGMTAGCPACDTSLRIPAVSHEQAAQPSGPLHQPATKGGVDLRARTVRIDLSDLE
jgi:DNA-binding protein HU-beta